MNKKSHTPPSPRFVAVCKRVFHADPAYFPTSHYKGKLIFFCTDSCLGAFLADPDRFHAAHSLTGRQKAVKDQRMER